MAVLSGVSFLLRLAFGDGVSLDDRYPKAETPYKAGYGIMRSEKYGNELFIWYPVSKELDEKKYERAGWVPHGIKGLKALIYLSIGWPIDRKWTPTFIYSGL